MKTGTEFFPRATQATFIMGKTNRNRENIFKWSIHRNGNVKSNKNHENLKNCFHTYSSYSIIPTSEVTQGAVDIWATLPDEIRQDPSLASFRQEHERIHSEYTEYFFSKSKVRLRLSLVYYLRVDAHLNLMCFAICWCT